MAKEYIFLSFIVIPPSRLKCYHIFNKWSIILFILLLYLQNKGLFSIILDVFKEGATKMANIKSSKKAIKVIAKKTNENHDYKARVKNSIKKAEKAILANDVAAADLASKEVQKNIDKAVSKGVMKKNTANREKSRINSKVKNMK